MHRLSPVARIASWRSVPGIDVELHLTPCIVTFPPHAGCSALVNPANERLEGTRFTPAKHERQGSLYRHLLMPRAGGVAFALSVLGDQLSSLLDVTVVYRDGPQGFWDLLCGRVSGVVVEIRELPVPRELCRLDYAGDPEARERMRAWIAELWQYKDERIEAIRSGQP